MPFQYWLLDFDETLVKGWDALAMNVVIPKFVVEHNLNDDIKKLNGAIVNAQQQAVDNDDVQFLLKSIFAEMTWPENLIEPFFDEIKSQYQPALFDDTLPFLQKLREHEKDVYILSNNPRATKIADELNLTSYVEAVLTPAVLPGNPRKPDIKVWETLLATYPHLEKGTVAIVGDDPTSEGKFADVCHIACWIVDRYERYQPALGTTSAYHWVRSLQEIDLS